MAIVIITLVYIIGIRLQCQQRGVDLGDKENKKGGKERERAVWKKEKRSRMWADMGENEKKKVEKELRGKDL